MQTPLQSNPPLTPAQQAMVALWEEHIQGEFTTRSTEDTLATMVEDAEVIHIPTLTGGAGKAQLREFYGQHFIPKMPPDTENLLLSRTVGADRIVDELLLRFTHTVQMDWILPGIPPTGKRVEVPLVVCVQFREGKMACEHIYLDQASILVQLGLLDAARLPVVGIEQARKMLDPTVPANRLIERADQRR
ncbi:MAG TPA: nuclear transport factor 2 family protein [Ktedonobacterales bacterium]|nr:nuclear transport factor 2 family protein [Ktedonobacterales bacterium]